MIVIQIIYLCTVLCEVVHKNTSTGDEDLWISMATIGRIEEFKEGKDDWSQYAERLEFFLKQTK